MMLHVDRLTLRLAGLPAAQARRLAWLVAECLAAEDMPGTPRASDRLRITVASRPGEPLAAIAQRIAGELVHALARSS